MATQVSYGNPQTSLSNGYPGLESLSREDDVAHVLQQASESQASSASGRIDQYNSWDMRSGMTPPMGQKRKQMNGEKKIKKEKNGKISTPVDLRKAAVPRLQGVAPDTTKFTLEHVASMSLDDRVMALSPNDSIRKMKELVNRKDIWTHNVILTITDTEITVKDGSTSSAMINIPLSTVLDCQALQDAQLRTNALTVTQQLPGPGQSRPHMHFFRCGQVSAEVVCKQIMAAVNNFKRHKGNGPAQPDQQRERTSPTRGEVLGDNWILGKPIPPPPKDPPPAPPGGQLIPPTRPLAGQAGPQPSGSPAISGSVHDQRLVEIPRFAQASKAVPPGSRNTEVAAEIPPRREASEVVKETTTKYTDKALNKATPSSSDAEVKKVMKATKIQRDVDLLNHVFGDLNGFKKGLRAVIRAHKEMEKLKLPKTDPTMIELRKQATPPPKESFMYVFQLSKLGINLLAKLSHHLASPSASELLSSLFKYIFEFVQINKGPQLATMAHCPLLTSRAVEFLHRKLTQDQFLFWRDLGTYWSTPAESWPRDLPLPGDFQVKFADGCVPPNLHNTSDRPSNFPTLDTLPRHQRGPDYSDAYDAEQQGEGGAGGQSSLMINPAVAEAVAAQVTTPIQSVATAAAPANKKASLGASNDNTRWAKSLFEYRASSHDELSVSRAEHLEVLDSSRPGRWLVRNRLGDKGYVPASQLEMTNSPARRTRADDQSDSPDARPPVPRDPPPLKPQGNPPVTSQKPRSSPQMPSSLAPVPEVLYELSQWTNTADRSSTQSPPPPLPAPALPGPPPPAPPLPDLTGGPGAAPPPPPPPPPIVALQPQISFSEMIAQHKLKANEDASKKPKKSISLQQEQGFEIAKALENRKPLRKTSSSSSIEAPSLSTSNLSELELKVNARKLSMEQEHPEAESAILPWKANKAQVKMWLLDQGFGGTVEKVECSAEKLYQMSRDELRDLCGVGDGVRLFSQLQKDKAQAQKEGGAVKESEFERLMRLRKTKAEKPGEAPPPPLAPGAWRQNVVDNEDGPTRQLITRRSERDLKSPTPQQPELKGKWGSRDAARQVSSNGDPTSTEDRRHKHSKEEASSGRRKGRRHSREEEEEEEEKTPSRRKGEDKEKKGRKKGNSHSKDEDTRQKSSKKSSKSKRSEDDDEDEDSGKEKASKKKDGSKKKGKNSKKPTNIDEFDEDEIRNSKSESDSESGSKSGSGSDSDAKGKRKSKSALIAERANARWALGEDDREREELERRIEDHQKEIKKQMGALQALQAAQDKKTLPPQQQKLLQQDLEGLKQIYARLEESPGNAELQMQLLGLQMVLCDHLKKFQEDLQHPYQPKNQNGVAYQQQQGPYPPQNQNGVAYQQQQQGPYPPQNQNGVAYQQQQQGPYPPQNQNGPFPPHGGPYHSQPPNGGQYQSPHGPYTPNHQTGDIFSPHNQNGGPYAPQSYPSPYSGYQHPHSVYPAVPQQPYVPQVVYPPVPPMAVPGHAAAVNAPLLEVQILVEKHKQLLEERKKLEEEKRMEEQQRKEEEEEQQQRMLEEQQRMLDEQKQMMEEQKRKLQEQQAMEEQKRAMEEQKAKLLQEQQAIEEHKRKVMLEHQQRSMMEMMMEQHQRAMLDQQRRAVEEQKALLEQQLEQQRTEKHQRLEKQRTEQQRLEQLRLDQQQRLEQQRLEQQRLEQQRLEQQRYEQQRYRELELQAQLSALRSPPPAPNVVSPLHPVAPVSPLTPLHHAGSSISSLNPTLMFNTGLY